MHQSMLRFSRAKPIMRSQADTTSSNSVPMASRAIQACRYVGDVVIGKAKNQRPDQCVKDGPIRNAGTITTEGMDCPVWWQA